MESLLGTSHQSQTYLQALNKFLTLIPTTTTPIYCLDRQARVIGMGLEKLIGNPVNYLNIGSEKVQPYINSLEYPDGADSNFLMQQLPHMGLQKFIEIYGLEFNSVIELLSRNQATPFVFDDIRGTGFTQAFTRRVFELASIPKINFITMQDLVDVKCFRENTGVYAGTVVMPWFNEIRNIFKPSKPQDFFLELSPNSPTLAQLNLELESLFK